MKTEWKIGEIEQVNGEWYQCLESSNCRCDYCDYGELGDCDKIACTSGERSDSKEVYLEKLEKVGEPYEKRISDGTFSKFQRYKVYNSVILPKEPYIYCNFIDSTVEIEIKQTKDMGEKDDIRPYDEHFSEGTVSNAKHLSKNNLKPFDFQKAKQGKPVCTRDRRKVRIISFDREFLYDGQNYCIVALISDGPHNEVVYSYTKDGLYNPGKIHERDLMMLPEKRSGWIVLRKDTELYNSEEAAKNVCTNDNYVPVKVEFEI